MFIVFGATGLSGCAGELAALAALTFSMSFAAWLVTRDRQRRALYGAENLRLAIASGQHRRLEGRLRQELALAAAGEAVSLERQWLARAQLGGLLVAEWRLDEAAAIYGTENDSEHLAPHLQALAAFGRHELSVLNETPDTDRLEAIRRDRDTCLTHVPPGFREDVDQAWRALEGLCLVRMGQASEGAPLLERGLPALSYNPALVVYLFHLGQAHEQMGERALCTQRYEQAMAAFPGTRLASEARARLHALAQGPSGGLFRKMLPETAPAASTALVPTRTEDEEPT